jgi:hypothetical protein
MLFNVCFTDKGSMKQWRSRNNNKVINSPPTGLRHGVFYLVLVLDYPKIGKPVIMTQLWRPSKSNLLLMPANPLPLQWIFENF